MQAAGLRIYRLFCYQHLRHSPFAIEGEVRIAIFDCIRIFYNCTRLHSSLAYTPIIFGSKLN